MRSHPAIQYERKFKTGDRCHITWSDGTCVSKIGDEVTISYFTGLDIIPGEKGDIYKAYYGVHNSNGDYVINDIDYNLELITNDQRILFNVW